MAAAVDAAEQALVDEIGDLDALRRERSSHSCRARDAGGRVVIIEQRLVPAACSTSKSRSRAFPRRRAGGRHRGTEPVT
jgi:hypothetical protein